MVVEAGNVLIIGARERLLSLHDFHTVCHSGDETFLRAREIFIREVHILFCDGYLLPGCLQIEKCSANVIVDLPSQVLGFRLALVKRGFSFSYVALDASAGENWNAHSRLKCEGTVESARIGPLNTIVSVGSQHRVALSACGRELLLG